MIRNKTDLLDPTAESNRSDYEKEVVEDAQNAGNSPKFVNTESDENGILQQTISAEAIKNDETSVADGSSDISGGEANLDETATAVGQNKYNR